MQPRRTKFKDEMQHQLEDNFRNEKQNDIGKQLHISDSQSQKWQLGLHA